MSVKCEKAVRSLATGLLMLMISVLLMMALAGCGYVVTKEKPKPVVMQQSTARETKQGDFVYRLIVVSPGEEAGAKPRLTAELEYVGDQDEITIYHAASPFSFFLKETTRGYDIGYMMDQPLIGTKLSRGEPLQETYKGGGWYTEQDSQDYIDFVKELMKTGFPSGQYEASGQAGFYTEEGGKKQDYKIKNDVTFTVDS
ncbi:hypothetical protein [Paenibacillus xylaniclasticus]|uniref:hypothetical protein n=1 Tax=Paenibacillus xylaniclasticus TaxID=588083 RepID=UPI000FDA57D4|nr:MULTISPECIES: hypothetical protein [Paenibacillus]GFN29952.1 hypothetical protein PCURB6_02120 [Paenibacillus curdlanolyticus]